MRGRGFALLLLTVALAVALSPPVASAFYDNGVENLGGAFLVSADYPHHEQADDTTKFAAISADGSYVAIETFARNFFAASDPDPPGMYRTGGIFRFDLQDKSLEKVADGNLFDEGTGEFARRGASNPSISADGRYVVFATAEQLIQSDTNENVDVYERDMDLPLPPGGACGVEPSCPYKLVSARDGGEVPAQYGPPQFPFPGSNPGADVSRGVAVSADGQKVAFRTEAPSDLPARSTADAPAGQIFVRDLVAQTTTLITAEREPDGSMGSTPAGGALGAAISADGSTVAWTGSNASLQTRFLAGENADPSFDYYLWRRAPFGPGQPTRRITGLSDPDDPACRQFEEANPGLTTSFDQISTGPCYGPLTDQEANRTGISAQLPALSGDGFKVAFVTGAGPRPDADTGTGLDLYLTDMTPGLTRKQATVELTRDPPTFDPATSSPLTSVAMSSDGNWLALTSVRTQFSLPALRFLGAPRTVPNAQELYVVDLEHHTIERATHAYDGSDTTDDTQNGVTLSADGSQIAFTSFAGDLYFGDANQRPDAFVVTREDEAEPEGNGEKGGTGQSTIEELGGPHISIQVRSVKGGIAVLLVSVPEAGRLRAVATAKPSAGGPRRTIARARGSAPDRGKVRMELRIGKRFRPHGDEKLRARAKVSFTPLTPGKHLADSARIVFSSR